jgi:bloom syndrome protein
VAEILKGSLQKKIVDNKHDKHSTHGLCKHWARGDIQRLLHHLIMKEFLSEELVVYNDIANAYIRLGPNVGK